MRTQIIAINLAAAQLARPVCGGKGPQHNQPHPLGQGVRLGPTEPSSGEGMERPDN